ncbi:hypothetical protein AALO_G00236930 [Alosa alosa]|uniref:SWIM-type domain-containing protein n=2 Tax=Alosa alosa TaxID=278164 RepID=A0AAV6FVQ2_9TELE|nr:uncharacterized protein LOC125311869 isoform X2 [Alosa alosa]KAG5266850.1 hypothetical protein AALO_G00236930 [Alosa alosa]
MAHCTCMAGLGEVCSHAAALMYTLLAAVEHREGQACTSEPCSWVEPSQSNIKYDELANIFVKKKAEKQVQPITPSSDELQHFLELLYVSETQEAIPKKNAILSVIEGHSPRYMPKTAKLDMPPLLTCLYSSTRLQLDLPTLLEEGAKIFEELHLTLEQCMLVEEKTREQRKSRWWFDHRAGRVTASAFYEAASTKNFPSLIKRICYPRSSHFSTEATRWGLQNEDTARESYWKAMQDLHIDFHITASGGQP